MLFLLLITALHCTGLPAQDPVEFARLATEQRQVAEQVRRLDQLLEILEQKDREEGRPDRAQLIAAARTQLSGAVGQTNLASVVEAVARELSSLHSGNALEGQAELIQTLQDLLDALVKTERQERQLAQEKALAQRLQALQKFAQQQKNLLEQTADLQQKQTSATHAPPQDPVSHETLEAKREELAELQSQLAEALNEFNQAQEMESGRRSDAAKNAEKAAQKAAEKMRGKSAESQAQNLLQQLEQAIQQQQEALEQLKRAQQQAKQQQNRLEDAKHRESLLNVMREAQQILDRHRGLEQELQKLLQGASSERISRLARSRMRQVSLAEKEIAVAAEKLLLTIDQAGADSFPLYIHGLSQDHETLSREVGPPRYRLQGRALPLAASLTADWLQLIDVIRTEQERIRKRMESPPGGNSQQNQEEKKERPLVAFSMELQLLKRMQQSLAERLSLLQQRMTTYADAGIESGVDETNDLEMLLDRQSELQLQFESMVRRLQGAEEQDQAEDV